MERSVSQVFGQLPYAAFRVMQDAGLIEKHDGKWIVTDEEKARQFKSCVTCKLYLGTSRTGKVSCAHGMREDGTGSKTLTNANSERAFAGGCENYTVKEA